MKYALVLCLLSGSLMKLTEGEDAVCDAGCATTFTTAAAAAGTDYSQLCKALQDYMSCLKACGSSAADSMLKPTLDALKAASVSCDLSHTVSPPHSDSSPHSDSRALSTSLLTVLGGPLLAIYKTFHL